MRFSITKRTLVWLIFLLCAIIYTIFLVSCSRGSLPLREPSLALTGNSTLTGIPALIQHIALVFAGMATVALFLAGIVAWFNPNKLAVAKYAAVAFGILISAGLLYWLADHWGWAIGLGAAALVAGLGGYAYLHKKDVRRQLCRVLNTPVKKD